MKRTTFGAVVLVAAFVLLLVHPALAQQSGPPRLSPSASVSQIAGITEIAITYARPSVKERAIWGELVPYDKVWRAGANEATTFAVSTDATVEGKPLAAGKYSLFTIPGKDKWTIIFNKVAEQWGAYQYDAAQDALRVEVKPTPAPFTELHTFRIDEVTATSARVVLHWEKLEVSFRVEVDTTKLAYEQALKDAADDAEAAFGWARHFYAENVHTEKALEWVDAAVAAGPSYWNLSAQARLQQRAGKVDEAKVTAKKAIGMAADDQYAQFAKPDAEELSEEIKSW
ncbi:MAG: DUF2911 domain-containing protein [bacterium]|nr:DUF2911 domain-containing protein [bacterium]